MTGPNQTENHNNPIPVSVCLQPVIHNGEIYLLGLTRGIMPKLGEIALIGGYVDTMETAKIACSREMLEEAGVKIEPSQWQLVEALIAPNNRLLLFSYSKTILQFNDIDFTFKSSETLGLELINQDTPIAFPLHKQMIDWFYQEIAPQLSIQKNNKSFKA